MSKFKMASVLLYWWPVEVKLPDPDKAGEIVTHTFQAQLQSMVGADRSAFEADSKTLEPVESDIRFLKRVLKNWSGIEGEYGEELPFEEHHVDRLLQIEAVRAGLFKGYFASQRGEPYKPSA